MRISSAISTTSIALAITTLTLATGGRSSIPEIELAEISVVEGSSPAVNQGASAENPSDAQGEQETDPVDMDSQSTGVDSEAGSGEAVSSSSPDQNASNETSPTLNESSPATAETSSPEPEAAPVEVTEPEPTQITVKSDPITYKYGTVQVQMSMLGSEIIGVQLLQGDTSYGRDAAYQTLIQATLQYQGTNYGNVSGATFTTEAFKLAVESALKKS